MDAATEAFDAFVAARYGALVRAAFVLTGDRHAAEELARSYGLDVRVVREDGRALVVFANYDPRRVDLQLQDGLVSGASFG